jgi:hypothetical protein
MKNKMLIFKLKKARVGKKAKKEKRDQSNNTHTTN